ncbi:MAG: division/cell wall cluster transcriptional repressor MraZ [Pseudomonadota bacterium]|nr:division/cell wall cluster transcriptional repressor MraZ [Pseudomonadota bacterium]
MIYHIVPITFRGAEVYADLSARIDKTGKPVCPVTSFISTYENKVDKKGRVSVPAAYRNALANEPYQGIIAYPSLTEPALEGFGRRTLEELNQRRFDQTMAAGNFGETLVGRSHDGLVETIMALANELPFDNEGRILLPKHLADHAGILTQAKFVGRGTRFQIWAPKEFEKHQQAEIESLRARIANDQSRGQT